MKDVKKRRIYRSYLDGRTQAEIANIEGCSIRTVQRALSWARKARKQRSGPVQPWDDRSLARAGQEFLKAVELYCRCLRAVVLQGVDRDD